MKTQTGNTAPAETTPPTGAEGSAKAAVKAGEEPGFMRQVETDLLGAATKAPKAATPKVEEVEQKATEGQEIELTAEELQERIEDAADEVESLAAQVESADEDERAGLQEQLDAKRKDLADLEAAAKDAGLTEGAEKSEETHEESEEDKALKGKLTPELQKSIDKRIGKEVGKRKQAEESLTAAQTELQAKDAQIAALQQRVDAKELPVAAAASGVHPTLLMETQAELDARKGKVQEFIEWAELALEEARATGEKNEDGEVIWTGKDAEGKDVTHTLRQILAEKQKAGRELAQIIPQAEATLKDRTTANATAKQVYPELFKAGAPEATLMATLLRKVPGLRTLPNAALIIGDMIAGERARQAQKVTKAKITIRQAPPAPTGGGRAPGAVTPLAPKRRTLEVSLKDSEVGKSAKGLTDLMTALSG